MLAVACYRVRALSVAEHAWDLLKEVTIIFITSETSLVARNYLHDSLASGQTTGREHSPALQQKTELKIY